MRDQQALRDDTFHSDQQDQKRRQGQRRALPGDQGQAEPDDNDRSLKQARATARTPSPTTARMRTIRS